MPGIAGDRTLALAMPVKALSPAWGKSVGGVSEGPTREIRVAEQSEHERSTRFATVEGIPVCGMALTFAGQRRNVDLGSVRRRERVSSPLDERTGDNGCPEEAEEGNDVRRHSSKCMHRARERGNAALSFRQNDASFAWSSDPCNVYRHCNFVGAIREGGAFESVSRSGKPGQPGRTGTGVETSGRCAARRLSPLPQGRGRGR